MRVGASHAWLPTSTWPLTWPVMATDLPSAWLTHLASLFSLFLSLKAFIVFDPIIKLTHLFIVIELFKPTVEIAYNIVWSDSWGSLQFSIHSMFVDLNNRINIRGFKYMQSNNFDSILLLIDMVNSFVNLSKASLANLNSLFEFFLESSSI